MKTVVITGASSGLGYECARILAAREDLHVVIASRDRARNEQAAERLREATPKAHVAAMSLDLASQSSVREFAKAVSMAGLPPLSALVCNAGLQIVSGTTYTPDGIETTFAVNHLGHFLLCNLLVPVLAPSSRIVLVSSGTHDPAQRTGMPAPRYTDALRLARPNTDATRNASEDPGVAGRRAYTTSKLCNVLCTYEMARRLQAQGRGDITVNAFDPGLMPGSGLARDYGRLQQLAWRFLLPALRLFLPNVHSMRDSGQSLARLVTDPALATVTGRYFEGRKERKSSAESYDAQKSAELWQHSAELVGLSSSSATAGQLPGTR